MLTVIQWNETDRNCREIDFAAPHTLSLTWFPRWLSGIEQFFGPIRSRLIAGNVHDAEGQSTYCARCHSLLIERDWYNLGTWNLDGNRCRQCGHTLAGVFESRPGSFGAKRQPVRIHS